MRPGNLLLVQVTVHITHCLDDRKLHLPSFKTSLWWARLSGCQSCSLALGFLPPTLTEQATVCSSIYLPIHKGHLDTSVCIQTTIFGRKNSAKRNMSSAMCASAIQYTVRNFLRKISYRKEFNESSILYKRSFPSDTSLLYKRSNS